MLIVLIYLLYEVNCADTLDEWNTIKSQCSLSSVSVSSWAVPLRRVTHDTLHVLTLYFLVAVVSTVNTKTHSSKQMAQFPFKNRLVALVVKASASRAEGPGFESRLRDFFGVESYQWLKNWHSSGYPARRLAL